MILIHITVLSIIVLMLDMLYITSIKNTFNKLVVGVQGSDIKLNLIATFLDYSLIIFFIF